MGTLQDLLDKQALHELVMTYCRAVDRRDFVLLRRLYHDDAVDDHGSFKGGPDAFVEWVTKILARFEATRHEITNTLFVVDGDYAEGENSAIAYHRTCTSTSPNSPASERIVAGRYLDRYRRRNGEWRFSYRTVATDWVTERTVDQAIYEKYASSANCGRAGAEDPSYKELRTLHIRRRQVTPILIPSAVQICPIIVASVTLRHR